MTTEIQTTTIDPKHSKNNSTSASTMANFSSKMATELEERKGNAIRPLSLRPNRSLKKNTSLKPLGLRPR